MAKIIYKEGCTGQNKLSCIEGIEIELLNGQKALIYPKYAERRLLLPEQIDKWDAVEETEIEALKIENIDENTITLFKIGSPAAEWALQFVTEKKIQFRLPSLLAALEIRYQKKEIDALAEIIEGADLLSDFRCSIGSCSRCTSDSCWLVSSDHCFVYDDFMQTFFLVVPTILYRNNN